MLIKKSNCWHNMSYSSTNHRQGEISQAGLLKTTPHLKMDMMISRTTSIHPPNQTMPKWEEAIGITGAVEIVIKKVERKVVNQRSKEAVAKRTEVIMPAAFEAMTLVVEASLVLMFHRIKMMKTYHMHWANWNSGIKSSELIPKMMNVFLLIFHTPKPLDTMTQPIWPKTYSIYCPSSTTTLSNHQITVTTFIPIPVAAASIILRIDYERRSSSAVGRCWWRLVRIAAWRNCGGFNCPRRKSLQKVCKAIKVHKVTRMLVVQIQIKMSKRRSSRATVPQLLKLSLNQMRIELQQVKEVLPDSCPRNACPNNERGWTAAMILHPSPRVLAGLALAA